MFCQTFPPLLTDDNLGGGKLTNPAQTQRMTPIATEFVHWPLTVAHLEH